MLEGREADGDLAVSYDSQVDEMLAQEAQALTNMQRQEWQSSNQDAESGNAEASLLE